MSEEVKRKRGRPKEEGSRTAGVRARVSSFELDILREASKANGMTLSEFIRVGSLKYASELSRKSDSNKRNWDELEDD